MANWKFNEVVVIDLEATCWDTDIEKANNTSEIIEIGVCLMDTMTGEIRKPQGIIVKPSVSKISPFCEQLTSITQDMVNQGIHFTHAINSLAKEYGTKNKMIAAFGNYDKNMLATECDRHGIQPPFGPTYLNISAMASLKLKAGKRLSLNRACDAFNLQFEGRLHRGVDDAVMAAKVLWECIK